MEERVKSGDAHTTSHAHQELVKELLSDPAHQVGRFLHGLASHGGSCNALGAEGRPGGAVWLLVQPR